MKRGRFHSLWRDIGAKIGVGVLVSLMVGAPVVAVECSKKTFNNNSFTVCSVDLPREELRLFLNDAAGAPYGQFPAIDENLARSGLQLGFAMNAGMYHQDRTPVGYYVENKQEIMRAVTGAGPGNFGLLPNGIFCVGGGRADVIETLRFVAKPRNCAHATQSGPMLVIDGALHPRFMRNSNSRYVRNGVGTDKNGQRAVFVISDKPVTFHAFGSFFRDVLKMRNALYFDGNVSRLYAPSIGRSDIGRPLGPIIGVVESRE